MLYFILILNLCDSPNNICWRYNLWSNIRGGVAHLVIYEGFLMARYIFNDFIWPYARFLEFELSVQQTTKYKYNRRLEQKKIVKLTCVKILKYRMYKLSPHFFTKIKWLLTTNHRTFNLVVEKINLKKIISVGL